MSSKLEKTNKLPPDARAVPVLSTLQETITLLPLNYKTSSEYKSSKIYELLTVVTVGSGAALLIHIYVL